MRAFLVAALLLAAPVAALPVAPAAAGAACFLEIVGPDLLVRYCLDPGNVKCLVYSERWGKEGAYHGKTCIVP